MLGDKIYTSQYDYNYTFKIGESLGHGMDKEQLEFVSKWIKSKVQ